jgi:DNA adenine methylase
MTAANKIKAPFPFFGGKSKAAELIWSRLGDCVNYVEPFAGSLAVLLSRPHYPFTETRTETVNDLDCYVANFWRAIMTDPDAVCAAADWPVNECDLHARHSWLHGQAERMERLKTDPEYFDARVAGYWAWGLSSWIGDIFCRPRPQRGIPHLGAGQGVNRKLPHLRDPGMGVADRRARLQYYFAQIADRLRGVRVCCGDWLRVLGPSPTFRLGLTGILLDPPYDVDGTQYGERVIGLSKQVAKWAVSNGDNPELRIAVCGYKDEGHTFPDTWDCVAWKAGGGYANLSDARNIHRERIWFSPHCLQAEQTSLL